MRGLVILSLVVFTTVSSEVLEIAKRKYKPDPLPVGGTDQAIHEDHDVVVEAKKMAKLLKYQDVVSTCRFMLFKTQKDFYEAKDHCENIEWPFTHNGIGIAKISNEFQNTEVRHLLQMAYGLKQKNRPYSPENWAWIGLSKRINNDRKLKKSEAGVYNASEWYWADGTSAAVSGFSLWHHEMPDQQYSKKYDEYQTWVMVNKRGYWDDRYAALKAPFVCNHCSKYIVVAAHASWNKARDLCQSYGLEFARVNSDRENTELWWAVNITFGPDPVEPRWNASNWIWLGTNEVLDEGGVGTGVWVHNKTNTEPGPDWKPVWDRKEQPDNWTTKRGEQQAVAFSRINSKWDDSFKHKKRPFACMCAQRACHFPGDNESL